MDKRVTLRYIGCADVLCESLSGRCTSRARCCRADSAARVASAKRATNKSRLLDRPIPDLRRVLDRPIPDLVDLVEEGPDKNVNLRIARGGGALEEGELRAGRPLGAFALFDPFRFVICAFCPRPLR
eukprot:6546656-Pyramimonas_sp.AAC.1